MDVIATIALYCMLFVLAAAALTAAICVLILVLIAGGALFKDARRAWKNLRITR